jgi:topoisomerase IA-like protein
MSLCNTRINPQMTNHYLNSDLQEQELKIQLKAQQAKDLLERRAHARQQKAAARRTAAFAIYISQ